MLALWVLTKAINPSTEKDIIINALYSITGQKIQIDGKVAWHLFPRPGIKISQAHMGEKDTKGNYILYIENLLINLQITPLFSGNFVFNELKIDDLNISFSEKNRYHQFKIAKIISHVEIKSGEISFKPLHLSLYSGKSVGDLSYKFDTKKLFLNQTAKRLNTKQLFMDLFNTTLAQGSMDFSMHATANLNNANWQTTVRGDGVFTIKNGILYFINLNQYVDNATRKIHSLLNQAADNLKLVLQLPFFTPSKTVQGSTNFKVFSAQYSFSEGRLISNSLLLQTNRIELKGNGEINFNNSSQNLNLSAKLITNDKAVNKIQQLVGGSFPVKVYGTLTDPKISPDNQYLNPIISTYLLKNTLEQPVKQIGNQFKDILKTPKNLLQDSLR